MTETTNLHLPQFEASDRIHHDDFNAAFQAIDTAVSGKSGIVTGSYTGDGSYGSTHPRILHFAFQPKLLLIQSEDHARLGPSGDAEFINGWLMALRGVTTAYSGSYSTNVAIKFEWDGSDVSWYATSASPGAQCNENGRKYYYLAIG